MADNFWSRIPANAIDPWSAAAMRGLMSVQYGRPADSVAFESDAAASPGYFFTPMFASADDGSAPPATILVGDGGSWGTRGRSGISRLCLSGHSRRGEIRRSTAWPRFSDRRRKTQRHQCFFLTKNVCKRALEEGPSKWKSFAGRTPAAQTGSGVRGRSCISETEISAAAWANATQCTTIGANDAYTCSRTNLPPD